MYDKLNYKIIIRIEMNLINWEKYEYNEIKSNWWL